MRRLDGITDSMDMSKLQELVMPSNHLILCCPLLRLLSIFPSIRVFSNESALYIRQPKYWSFSFNINLSSEHRTDLLQHGVIVSPCSPRDPQESYLTPQFKSINSLPFSFLYSPTLTSNLDSILKSRDITLSTKVHLVKAMVFPVVVYGCESWTVKKAERRRIDAFELWC